LKTDGVCRKKKSETLKSGNVLNQNFAYISVIIPAYNRAGLIGATLRSLLNQTVPAKEIIVIDDGSTDGTAEAVEHEFSVFREQFSAKSKIQNPTLKILRQQNAGPGAARNRGVAVATGDFIHFFDSDDIAAPNKHEVQLRALLETGADIAYGPWVKGRFVNLTTEDTESTEEEAVLSLGKPSSAAFSNPSTSELARDSESTSLTRCMTALALDPRRSTLDSGPGNFVPEGPVLQAKGLPRGSLIKALLTNWSIVPHACLFRTSIVKKIGGFAEESFGYEDQFMFLRCLLAGAKIVHTPGTLELYRLDNPGKLTEAGDRQKKFSLECARFLLQAKDEVERREWFSYHPPNTITVTAPEKNLTLDSPVQWFGYRLRAYEAWQDLEKFFPGEKGDFKEKLERIFLLTQKNRKVEMFIYKAAGFLIRKFGGLKQRIVGHRWSKAYRCGNKF
jgi:GT2 family glycosyltransferase